MDATVRKAGLGDEGVMAVMNRVVERLYATRSSADSPPVSTRFVVDRFQMLLRRSSVRAWVAEREGETLGYVLAQFYARRSDAKGQSVRIGIVEQLVVYCDEDERCPLFVQLLQAVYEQAQAEGLQHVELSDTVTQYLEHCGIDPATLRLHASDER